MDARVKVRIVSPVRFGSAWLKPGDEVEIDLAERAELEALGVIDTGHLSTAEAAGSSASQEAFEAAVAAQARVIAETIVEAAVSMAMGPLEAARDEALARAGAAEAEVAALKAELAARDRQAPAASSGTAMPKTAKRAAAKDQTGG